MIFMLTKWQQATFLMSIKCMQRVSGALAESVRCWGRQRVTCPDEISWKTERYWTENIYGNIKNVYENNTARKIKNYKKNIYKEKVWQ